MLLVMVIFVVFLMQMVMVKVIVVLMLMVFFYDNSFFVLIDTDGQIDVDCHADVLSLMLMLRFTVILICHDDIVSKINADSVKSVADAGTCSKEGGTQQQQQQQRRRRHLFQGGRNPTQKC